MGLGLSLGLGGALQAQQPDLSPDTIYVHGNVLTGVGLETAAPERVTAFAVTRASIVATGTEDAVMKLRGPHTLIVDLHGAFAMPGFNDAHTHMALAGRQKLTVDLDGTPSLADMLERIRIYTAAQRPGAWILGSGWDHTRWASPTLPTRGDLDKVTGGASGSVLPYGWAHRCGELGGAAGGGDRRGNGVAGWGQDRCRCRGYAYGHRARGAGDCADLREVAAARNGDAAEGA